MLTDLPLLVAQETAHTKHPALYATAASLSTVAMCPHIASIMTVDTELKHAH